MNQETKQLWQMTRAEYESKFGNPKKNTTLTGGFSHHKSAVECALNRGCLVPIEVLADYPDLLNRTR
jgi:hypothetical protein